MKIVCDGEHDVRSARDSESETPRHRESGTGQPHSKTCRRPYGDPISQSVLECGCPLPLSGAFLLGCLLCLLTTGCESRDQPMLYLSSRAAGSDTSTIKSAP